MQKAYLNPTAEQTFEIVGDCNFRDVLSRAARLQSEGDVERACNERFHAFQLIAELLPEGEEVNLEWSHPNTRAAMEVIYGSAIDHFLINDFEMSTAMLEQLLDVDPEDHLECVVLLAFNYLAMEEYEAFDEIINDISDKYASRTILMLWSSFRQTGAMPDGELYSFRQRFAAYHAEFTADTHPADEEYLRDIESEHSSLRAQARELWLQTENLWTLHPDFIEAIKNNE